MTKEVNHVARAHSLLSPSGSARWINCPPSLRLEEEHGVAENDGTSGYTLEGTLAHEMAEVILRRDMGWVGPGETLDHVDKALEECTFSPFYYDGMEDDVEVYTNLVKDRYELAESMEGKVDHASVEDSVPLSFLIPEGDEMHDEIKDDHGTVDFSMVAGEELTIIDLKFGRGVRVNAQGNSQLRVYAYARLLSLPDDKVRDAVKTVRMIIVQPRVLAGVTEEVLTVEELTRWIEDVAKPAAALALAGEGVQRVGDWCMFCKVKPICRAQKEHAMDAVRGYFPDKTPELMSDEEVIEMHEKSHLIIAYLTSISSYMLNAALGGKKFPGYKVVEGKSNRRWGSEEGAARALLEQGFDDKDIYNVKLKGLGDITRLVGKGRFDEVVGEHVVKPQGAPTLVRETDKRPEFTPGDRASAFFDPVDD